MRLVVEGAVGQRQGEAAMRKPRRGAVGATLAGSHAVHPQFDQQRRGLAAQRPAVQHAMLHRKQGALQRRPWLWRRRREVERKGLCQHGCRQVSINLVQRWKMRWRRQDELPKLWCYS